MPVRADTSNEAGAIQGKVSLPLITTIVTTALGLVFGLLTGYYFERRSSQETRRHNAELQAQLRLLRDGIYSVGRGGDTSQDEPIAGPMPLTERTLRWIRQHQGPDGRVESHRVFSALLVDGFATEAVEGALHDLESQEHIRREKAWIQTR